MEFSQTSTGQPKRIEIIIILFLHVIVYFAKFYCTIYKAIGSTLQRWWEWSKLLKTITTTWPYIAQYWALRSNIFSSIHHKSYLKKYIKPQLNVSVAKSEAINWQSGYMITLSNAWLKNDWKIGWRLRLYRTGDTMPVRKLKSRR